jgi:magnesium chelatase family protein
VPGIAVRGAETLRQVIDFIRASVPLPQPPTVDELDEETGPDLAEVLGQDRGRFALELAAAGRHHLALFGPSGAGKTMLAQRLPSILPPLDDAAALAVTALHSIAGLLPPVVRLIRRPPFQAPHHTASAPALVGGGAGLARPGALSLAHEGVLFLDECK